MPGIRRGSLTWLAVFTLLIGFTISCSSSNPVAVADPTLRAELRITPLDSDVNGRVTVEVTPLEINGAFDLLAVIQPEASDGTVPDSLDAAPAGVQTATLMLDGSSMSTQTIYSATLSEGAWTASLYARPHESAVAYDRQANVRFVVSGCGPSPYLGTPPAALTDSPDAPGWIEGPALPALHLGSGYAASLPAPTSGVAPFSYFLVETNLTLAINPLSGLVQGTVVDALPSDADGYVVIAVRDSCSTSPRETRYRFAIPIEDAVPAVCDPLTIATEVLPPAILGTPYEAQLLIGGAVPPLQFTISPLLPPGLSIDGNGVISGTATAAGNFFSTLLVSDACTIPRSIIVPLNFQVIDNTPTCNPPAFVAVVPPAIGKVGTPYDSLVIIVGGTQPYTISAIGSIPPGLIFGNDGHITGTPGVAGTFNFSLVASDSCPAGPLTVVHPMTITINADCPDLDVFSGTANSGVVGSPYSYDLQINSGTPPYITTLPDPGQLPAGLFLNGTRIEGTPTTAISTDIPIVVIDSCVQARSTVATLHLVIAPASSCSTLSLTEDTPTNGWVGVPYSYPVPHSGGQAPISYEVVSNLPPGLALNPNTAVLSGTPTAAGSYYMQIRAVDDCAPSQVAETWYLIQIIPLT
ncbi:MAG: putative Ig domain-containing protein [bacterium]